MFQDMTIQIFLTVFHGQFCANFFYDYIIRNSVRLFFDGLQWSFITSIVLGVFFIATIIWAVLCVWGKQKRNLIISAIILLVILVIRISLGAIEMVENKKTYSKRSYYTELAVFISQIVVHTFGVIGTYILSTRAS